jgi:hypothetical protein
MRKHFETTFKRINLRLRGCHFFKHFIPNQTLNVIFVGRRNVRHFKNVYVQDRHTYVV